MTTREKLLSDIKEFIEIKGVSRNKFGLLSVRDHKLIGRLEGGGKIFDQTIDKIYEFMKNYDQ